MKGYIWPSKPLFSIEGNQDRNLKAGANAEVMEGHASLLGILWALQASQPRGCRVKAGMKSPQPEFPTGPSETATHRLERETVWFGTYDAVPCLFSG